MGKVIRNRKRNLSLAQKRKILGVVFIVPSILGLLMVFIPAMLLSLKISFSDIKLKGVAGYELIPAGWQYYHRAFFVDAQFPRVLVDSFSLLWVQVLIIIIFSLFMSTVLNQKFRGRGLARAILFLPVILASGLIIKVDAMSSVGGANTLASNIDTGSLSSFNFIQLEQMLRSINFMPGVVDTVIGAVNGLYDIILKSGVQILVFLAGLQSISTSLYEAARVDGITSWQSFWKITIPMISPLILVNIIYTIISSFADPQVGIMTYVQGVLNTGSQYSFASALSWIYFMVMIVSIGIVTLVSRKLIFYNT